MRKSKVLIQCFFFYMWLKRVMCNKNMKWWYKINIYTKQNTKSQAEQSHTVTNVPAVLLGRSHSIAPGSWWRSLRVCQTAAGGRLRCQCADKCMVWFIQCNTFPSIKTTSKIVLFSESETMKDRKIKSVLVPAEEYECSPLRSSAWL